jgi:hypothetical protein
MVTKTTTLPLLQVCHTFAKIKTHVDICRTCQQQLCDSSGMCQTANQLEFKILTLETETTENVLLLHVPLVLRKFIFPPTES